MISKVSAFFFLCCGISIVGFIVHGLFGFTEDPSGLCRIHLLGLWLSTLSLFYSIQGVINSRALTSLKNEKYIRKQLSSRKKIIRNCFLINLITGYYLVSTIISLVIVSGYFLGERIDGTLWASFLSLISFVNFIILKKYYKSLQTFNKKQKVPLNNQSENKNFLQVEIAGEEEGEEKEEEGENYNNNNNNEKEKLVYSIFKLFMIGINRTFKILCLILLILLANGSLLNGTNRYMFPPRGEMINVTLSQGTKSQFHFICEGNINSNLPVFWLEVSGNHHLEEFKGIRDELLLANRRYCIHDPPGQGYSSSSTIEYVEYYQELMNSLKDKGPFIMLGWAGGGTVMYSYALKYPKNVLAIAFLDSYPGGYEWDYLQLDQGLSDQQVEIIRSQELKKRLNLLNLLRGLAAPFGITPFFFPTPIGYVPQEHAEESNHHILLDKTWNTQYYLLKQILYNGDSNSFDDENIDKGIEILTMVTVPSNFRNESSYCEERGLEVGSPECLHEMKMSEYSYESRVNLTKRVNRSYIIHCIDCSFSFPMEKPHFVVQNILKTFQHIQLP